MRRIITAFEQLELLSPWIIHAGPDWPARRPRALMSDQLDVDQLTKNILAHYDAASDENRADGENWYPATQDWLRWNADKNGHSFTKAAAILASLSPQRRFSKKNQPLTYPGTPEGQLEAEESSNVGDALRFFHHWTQHGNNDPNGLGHGTVGDNYERVMRVHQAPDDDQSVLDALRSVGNGTPPKVSNFFRALQGDKNATVIDTWMARGILGQNGTMVPREEAIRWLGRKGHLGAYEGSAYQKMADAITNAARLRGVDPTVMQATVWTKLNDSHYDDPEKPLVKHPKELTEPKYLPQPVIPGPGRRAAGGRPLTPEDYLWPIQVMNFADLDKDQIEPGSRRYDINKLMEKYAPQMQQLADRHYRQRAAGRHEMPPHPGKHEAPDQGDPFDRNILERSRDFLMLHPRSYDPHWKPVKRDPRLTPYKNYDNPLDQFTHYLTDDPAMLPEDQAQWGSQWMETHPDPGPPPEDAEFAEWLFRGMPDDYWADIPYPGAPWTPETRQKTIEYRQPRGRDLTTQDIGYTRRAARDYERRPQPEVVRNDDVQIMHIPEEDGPGYQAIVRPSPDGKGYDVIRPL